MMTLSRRAYTDRYTASVRHLFLLSKTRGVLSFLLLELNLWEILGEWLLPFPLEWMIVQIPSGRGMVSPALPIGSFRSRFRVLGRAVRRGPAVANIRSPTRRTLMSWAVRGST